MESNKIISLALAYYKDKVQREVMERFREESMLLLKADADARRMKARENILAMVKLKNELVKFKWIYDSISNDYGSVEALDEYIRQIEVRIRLHSFRKNNI